MKISTVSFSKNGDKLNKTLYEKLTGSEEICIRLNSEKTESLSEWTEKAFRDSDALIFIGAAGIAVRAIAPFIKRKDKDPAVIVCDELGYFVIPILSGHIGGANELAHRIAEILNATPVITTATDINNVWAVDTWAVKHGYTIENPEAIKYISSALLRGEKVGIVSDVHRDIDEIFGTGGVPENLEYGKTELRAGISISPYLTATWSHTLHLVPMCLIAGVGSRKGANKENAEALLRDILKKENLSIKAISDIATIDIKKDEPTITELSKKLKVPLTTYSSDELNDLPEHFRFEESDFVKNITGTGNVCERSAVRKALEYTDDDKIKIVVPKTKGDAVTAAIVQYR